jgi:hypothetical protein
LRGLSGMWLRSGTCEERSAKLDVTTLPPDHDGPRRRSSIMHMR